MALNPLAEQANAAIQQDCPVVYDLLSTTGRALFFPKGILSQSAEAKGQATRYNATIGIATEGGEAMHIEAVHKHFSDLKPDQLYPYAPSTGNAELRAAWQAKQWAETPSLGQHLVSLPVVTNALTHALDLAGELFLDPGDEILVPDQMWGNYKLSWQVRRQANLVTFTYFTSDLVGFNLDAFAKALRERVGQKLMVVLNCPNNPTGYTPTKAEAQAIVAELTRAAEAGTRIIAVCDDAYYGMFYDDQCQTESLFGALATAHDNLLAIKVDGATKELFVWGLRVGFITYGVKNGTPAMYKALEQKTGGAIRGAVSNINQPGQQIILDVLKNQDWRQQQTVKVEVLRKRADSVHRMVYDPKYADCWDVYPFNSGYFMCLRVKNVDAEALRLKLLSDHGIGTISLNHTDLRVAFSCVEEADLADLFKRIAETITAMR